jgi:hypothetical protein
MDKFLDRLALAILVVFGISLAAFIAWELWASYGWPPFAIIAAFAVILWASFRVETARD